MKTTITAILLATTIAQAETYSNIPETAITPTEHHYGDGRLLDLDRPLYRHGEIVKLEGKTFIVWDAGRFGRGWRYVLQSAKIGPEK